MVLAVDIGNSNIVLGCFVLALYKAKLLPITAKK